MTVTLGFADPALSLRWCPECGDERGFDAPPCLDGHGADCPERACVECGFAILLDPPRAGTDDPVGTDVPAGTPEAPPSQESDGRRQARRPGQRPGSRRPATRRPRPVA